MDLNALIAAERARIDDAPENTVDVVLGGEKVTIGVRKMEPRDWANLAAKHPPRRGSVDAAVGYNQEALPGDYDTERITVGGEPVDADQWRRLYAVLGAPYRVNVSTVMWGVNVWEEIKALRDLGKATVGERSSSPASTESPRDGGTGGSPLSGPPTTMTRTGD